MGKSVYERFGTSQLTGSDQIQRRHVVMAGETLPMIASDELGIEYDAELWRQVAEDNDVNDLDALAPGAVLVINPPKPSDS